VNALKATSVPLRTPAARLPVQRVKTYAVVQPLRAYPAISTTLCTNTGEKPAHVSGAPISD
jgi:hypothetical protein